MIINPIHPCNISLSDWAKVSLATVGSIVSISLIVIASLALVNSGITLSSTRAYILLTGGCIGLVATTVFLAIFSIKKFCIFKSSLEYKIVDGIIGPEKLQKAYSSCSKAPPLPLNILEILNAPCPFWQDKKVFETHTLILFAEEINNIKVDSLELLNEIFRSPNQGYIGAYLEKCYKVNANRPLGHTFWALVTNDIVPQSINLTYDEQVDVVRNTKLLHNLQYEIATSMEVTMNIFTNRAFFGKSTYLNTAHSNYQPHFARCPEMVENKRIKITGYSEYSEFHAPRNYSRAWIWDGDSTHLGPVGVGAVIRL